MSAFAGILGHAAALEALDRMLMRGRIPHALLIEGPAGVGKMTVARRFAAALLCESDPRPCGACQHCRLQAHDHHPDVRIVTLEPRPNRPKELRKSIVIEQVRDLAALAAQGPRLARRRVFLIDPADRMLPAAQNALLKTLEEPPGGAILLLCASRPALLIPTVRSRCFVVPLAALRTTELTRLLLERGMAPDEAAARAALAEGRPGLALDLDVDERRERREQALCGLEALCSGPAAAAGIGEIAKEMAGAGDDDLVAGLELLQSLVRDAARAAGPAGPSGDDALVHADLADRLERVGARLGAERAAAIVGLCDRVRADLRFNVNRTLAAEAVLAAVAGGPVG